MVFSGTNLHELERQTCYDFGVLKEIMWLYGFYLPFCGERITFTLVALFTSVCADLLSTVAY